MNRAHPKQTVLDLFGEERALRERALAAHRRLGEAYGCPLPWFAERDPLSTLVSALLSHRTHNADSGRAFRALRARFDTWERVRDAPVAEVEAAVADATWPEQKAPRLQDVLRRVTARRGALSLDFLGELPVPAARAWLEALPGVGPKTSASVMLFSTPHRAALPVDCHHHRVAVRLGLVKPSVPVADAHTLLEQQLPAGFTARDMYDHHEALMLHGQRCCHAARPACERCPVLDLCPHGQAQAARQSA